MKRIILLVFFFLGVYLLKAADRTLQPLEKQVITVSDSKRTTLIFWCTLHNHEEEYHKTMKPLFEPHLL